MYIVITNIDAGTGKICTEDTMQFPSLPNISNFQFQFDVVGLYPIQTTVGGIYLQAPLYYGTCDDDTDTSLTGVVKVLTETEFNADKETEHQARKPYPSWVGDLATMSWNPPVPYPQDGNFYQWDEPTVSWVLVNAQSASSA
jgi:hypothetical protein